MSYTNSSLVNYTRLSPNYSAGRVSIIGLAIHCVVGQTSVETLGAVFAQSSKQASSNYGVGYDGRIGLYVEEKNRSWCTSSSYVDNRCITIEVASDTYSPYAVTDAAYSALIKLCADICKRNGIKKLVWSTDANKRKNFLNGCNMQVHRDWANKACPGDYLYERMGDIAAKVNDLLGADTTPENDPAPVDYVTLKAQQLQRGDSGNAVWALQWLLNSWASKLGKNAFWCGTADGQFGANTEKGVKGFQKEYGLPQTGVVDGNTWAYLLC